MFNNHPGNIFGIGSYEKVFFVRGIQWIKLKISDGILHRPDIYSKYFCLIFGIQ